MWWHGGAGLTERSERGSLSAVATHVVFCFSEPFMVNPHVLRCDEEEDKQSLPPDLGDLLSRSLRF